jgi:hypothetical protein
MEELRDSAALRAAFSGDPLLLCAGAATDPNFRSQRLAERVCGLVSHTLVSERGRAALIADTWNTAAIALYQRLGPGWPDLAQPESERAVIDHCFPEYGEGFRRASRTCVARAVILPEVRSGGGAVVGSERDQLLRALELLEELPGGAAGPAGRSDCIADGVRAMAGNPSSRRVGVRGQLQHPDPALTPCGHFLSSPHRQKT